MYKVLLFFILVLSSSCAKNPANDSYDFVIMNEKEEYKIGRNARLSIPNSKIYKNSELQKYLTDLAHEIYDVGERTDKNFTFYFVNNDDLNAYATPGYVFFNRGMLPYFQDQASLMGLLAHEIGHINARHLVQKRSNDFLIRWFLNSFNSATAYLTKSQMQNIHELSNLAYSRSKEQEADDLSVRYLEQLRVPAGNTAMLFKSIELQENIIKKTYALNPDTRKHIPERLFFYSTHPSHDSRVNSLESASGNWVETMDYYKQEEFYKMIDGLDYGYSGSQGKDKYKIIDSADVVESAKSGAYGFKNNLYLTKYGLKVVLPEHYQARVMSYDPMGYDYENGVVFSIKQVSDDKHLTVLDIFAEIVKLEDYEKESLVEDIKDQSSSFNDKYMQLQENTGLQEQMFFFVDSKNILSKLLGVNSMYYYVYIKQIDELDENGEHDGIFNTFRVMFLASDSKKSFDETMLNDILFIKDNLVELTQDEKKKIKPLTIKTKKAEKAYLIEDLAKEYIPYTHFSEDWFKALNGIYNEHETGVSKGQWLKLIHNPNKDL